MTGETTLVDPKLFPRLVVQSGGRVVDEVDLRNDMTIGRAEESDLQLMDPKASRHHARIRREGTAFVLKDLDSANGTRVNGVLITQEHRLEHGERITIGDTDLIYQEPVSAVQDTMPMAVVRPEEAPPAGGEVMSRGMIAGLILVAAVVFVGMTAALIWVLAPEFYARIGLVSATETPAVATQPSATQPAAGGSPVAGASPTVITATPTPGGNGVGAGEADELLTQAEALARRSKFEEAEAIYQELTGLLPDDARPEIGWAWALILDDRATEALPHAERALELDPESAAAATVAGRAHAALDEVERAVGLAEQAVELAPGSAGAHAVLAEAYMLDGDLDAAVDEADLALVQDINSAEAHRIRGWLYHVTDNDLGRAASELQIAAGLQPELWLRRHDLGVLLLDAEDYVTAIMAFQDALGIRPKAITYTAIGEAYYSLGQYDQAQASLQQAISAGADNADTYGLLALTYAHLNECDEAETYVEQAIALEPGHPWAEEAQELCESGEPVPTPTATTTSSSEATPVATPATSGETPPTPRPASLTGRIAFPAWNQQTSNYDTYVANIDGSGRQLVTEEMHQPALDLDGEWVAVNGERDEHQNLFIVRPDGSGLHEITTNIEDGLPAWSPDGNALAFSSTRHGDKQSRIYVIDEVPFQGGKVEGRSLNFGPDDVRGEHPAWTSDNRIVYAGCDLTVEPAPCGLYLMSAAPGAHPFEQLTDRQEDTAPAVYGERIAFMSNREGNWEIYIVGLDGTGLERLTNNAANDGLPVWSPDGRTIAFVSDQGGGWAVWAMSPDGSNQRKLFQIGGGGLVSDWQHERISWSR
jgi:TolB protein